MIKLQIDNKIIEVEEGVRLIEAARQNGIEIPSLCYRDDLPHYTSCSVCLVKNEDNNKFLHSCSILAEEGMKIDASSEEVLGLRKDAISMLLSEHRAECEAPCKVVCPLGLNIPLMNRYIQKGDLKAASELAFNEMGLPETMCFLCPEYCENACRRKMIDETIAIVNVKSYSSNNYILKEYISGLEKPSSGKRIAIVGGGISGLTASFFLAKQGHYVVIFEKEEKLGGSILKNLENDDQAKEIFEQEVDNVLALGVEIKYDSFIDKNRLSTSLISEFDSILISTPGFESIQNAKVAESYILTEGDSMVLKGTPIFRIGKAAKQNKQIIRDISQAKKAALAIDVFLKNGKLNPIVKAFNSAIGKIEEHEKKVWLKETPKETYRYKDPQTLDESIKEVENCMHCDCRAQNDCQLRNISEDYKLSNPKMKMYSHPIEKKINYGNGLIFENAKCIKCGLCVRLLQKETNEPGLGFQGRGFMSIISEPLTHTFQDALNDNVDKLVDICPTAALSKLEDF